MALALFATLALIGNFRYENSDDLLMVKPFMGFEGGISADFTLYTHTLLAWALHGLSMLFPAVAWFSVYQIALLFLSVTVLGKSVAQLTKDRRRPWLAAFFTDALLLGGFAVFACCRVSYTSTAGLAGAAAMAQLLSSGFGVEAGELRVRDTLPSLLLLIAAYCLRAVSVVPALCFVGLCFVTRGLTLRKTQGSTWRRAVRPLLIALAVYVGVFGALAGIRQVEIAMRGLQPYMAWQDARIKLMDYTDFQTDPAPALAANSGLSAAEVEMVRQWYFMSADIDTTALTKLAAAYGNTQDGNAFSRLASFFSQNPRYAAMAATIALLTLLCFLGARRHHYLTAAAVTALLGALVMLLYLGIRGRLVGRGVDTVLMPCAAMLFCLALLSLPPIHSLRAGARIATLALLALTLAVSSLNLRDTYRAVTRTPDATSQQREAELETYALSHADLLIVRSTSLLRDTRLLPDCSAGMPANIALWGDWGCRTPSWNRQLARFGLDAEHFAAQDWLGGRIVFAAATETDAAPLIAYLSEALGTAVEATPYGDYGTLLFFKFQSAQ